MADHQKQPSIYLDYAATTPVDARVIAKMNHCLSFSGVFANPASPHSWGQAAAAGIAEAREQVATLLHTTARTILFTSGATEAINWAIKGVAFCHPMGGKHIVTTQIEHKAALASCQFLEQRGFSVTYLKPTASGIIDPDVFEHALRPDTILASVHHVNNETGVIQDIAALGAIARRAGVLLHVDAAQSVGKVPIDLQQLPVDLLSCSAHKLYGPKGVGALYVSDCPRVSLMPLLHGGGQERKMRGGTLATHQIVGFGEACHWAAVEMNSWSTKIREMRDHFWHGLVDIPDVSINGYAAPRIPEILNVCFRGNTVTPERVQALLQNVAVSRASACNTLTLEPSPVLLAMGLTRLEADCSVRFSLGRLTTPEELEYVAAWIRRNI